MDDLISENKLAIHQPNFMPWMGYFLKMAQADSFVLLNDVQFSKGSYTPRVKMHDVTRLGSQWLTVPTKKHALRTPIEKIQLDRSKDIENTLLDRISSTYSETEFFQQIMAEIELMLPELKQYDLLSDFNRKWIEWLREKLQIDTPLLLSSEIATDGTSEQVILRISRAMNTSIYISGEGGKSYIDRDAFSQADIDIQFIDYANLLRERFADIDQLGLADKSALSWIMLVPLQELRGIFQY